MWGWGGKEERDNRGVIEGLKDKCKKYVLGAKGFGFITIL